MAYSQNIGGSVNNTNGFTSYPSNFVYNTSQDGFPGGNLGADGVRRVRIASVTAAYATGASGINPRTNRGDAGATVGGGGSFRLEIAYSSGTLNFGRNTGGGGSVVDNADGGTWGGKLVGALGWYTYPTVPQSIALSRSGRNVTVTITGSASNGGEPISAYYVQASSNGGASWGPLVNISDGSHTYTNLPPGTDWVFRTFARNALGDGQIRHSASISIPAGGKRYTGTAWAYTSIARRHNGTAWVDLTIARRHNGTAWVDLG